MSFYQQGCISAALYYFKMALLIYQIGHQLSQCPTITLQNATILHRTAKSPISNKQLPPPATTSSATTPSSLAYQHIVSALSSTSSLHNDRSNATTIDSIHKQALGAIEMIETTYYLLPTISTSASGGSNNNNEEYQSLLLNIAHCYRKLKQFNHSLIYYSLCLHISSTQLVTFECYTGLGMCYHLLANIINARQMYILALSIQPENALINQLMTALSYTIALNTTSPAVSNLDTTISNGGGPKPQA
jgi:tetratricopeptide (TPR) repeat protein